MKKNKTRIRKPVMKWQTGEFQRTQNLKFELPLQFLMICKLVNVSPEEIISDFMDNLAFGSWKREGREKARQLIVDYFIAQGYGRDLYSPEDIKSLFAELDAMGLLFPKDGEPQIIDAYSSWRDNHRRYWFEKWYNK
jgi:hypothetical protein